MIVVFVGLLGLAAGFTAGVVTQWDRARRLAENNDWVGEDLAARKGVALFQDLAEKRRTDESPVVELYDQDNEGVAS